MATLNIKSLSTLNGSSTGKVLTTTSQDIITTTTSTVNKVNHLMVTNITGASANVTVGYYDSVSATTIYLLYTTAVPAYAAIDVLNKAFYLKEGDKITALASAGTTIHLTASWEALA
jgi:hypothetical protein